MDVFSVEQAKAMPSEPFVALQAVLRKERMFVVAQRTAIKDLYVDINDLTRELMDAGRNCRRAHWDLHLFNNQKIQFPEWEMRNKLAHDPLEFVDAQMKLEEHTTPYEDLLRAIKSRPAALASCLYQYNKIHATSSDSKIDDLLRCVLFTIHGNFFFPEEEQAVLTIMWELVKMQLNDHSDRNELFLRSSSAFTRFFMLYAREYSFKGHTFLIAALRDPILAVLADDDLEIEFDPILVYNKLSPAERAEMFGPEYQDKVQDTSTLIANPKFMVCLGKVFDRLVRLCTHVVDSLTVALASMPFSMRLLAKRLADSLKNLGLSQPEIWTALANVVLLRYVTPAIASPEPVGIVTDTPISTTARRNLTIIARTFRDINRGVFNAEVEHTDPYLLPLHQRLHDLGQNKISAFLNEMISISTDSAGLSYPPYTVNHRGRRRVIGISMSEIQLLHDMLDSLELPDDHAFAGVHQQLPTEVDVLDVEDRSVLVVSLGDDVTIGGLLSEKDVSQQIKKYSKNAPVEKEEVLTEAVLKLRACLCEIGFSMQWKHLNFVQVLEAELCEASAMGNQHSEVQLQACLRCLKKLPKSYFESDSKEIYDALKLDYLQRQPYVSYLVSTLESLTISKELIKKHIKGLEYSTAICTKFFNMTRVRRFLEQHMTDLTQFVSKFKQIEMLDEKSAYLGEFLQQMYGEMAADPTWAEASPEELEDSRLLMEKRFLTHVYRYVFFPHDSSQMNDQLFWEHIKDNLGKISADHECLQIREECRGEMPWPTAQKCLLRMNAYKTPSDKLNNISKCCTTLMELLQLSGKSAGADDFFPLLVFVILKANPPNLLATIQYINFFGSSAINSGEGSYWFAQFQTAVTFIQSIDDREIEK